MCGDVLNNDNETCHNKLKMTNHALDALLVFISLSNGYMFLRKTGSHYTCAHDICGCFK